MDNRELFHATMKHENGNELLHMEQGFNIDYNQWKQDGLPENVKNADFPFLSQEINLFDYMNVAGYLYCRFDQFCVPAFDEEIIEQCSDRKIYRNSNGAILKKSTIPLAKGTHSYGLPQEIDFTIKTLEDYQKNRYRFLGNIKNRVSIQQNVEDYRTQRNNPTALWVHGPFAFLREIVGTKNAMILPYDEPKMIKMILDDHLETSMAAAELVVRAYKPDM